MSGEIERRVAEVMRPHLAMEADRRLWDDDEYAAYGAHASESFTAARDAAMQVHAAKLAAALAAEGLLAGAVLHAEWSVRTPWGATPGPARSEKECIEELSRRQDGSTLVARLVTDYVSVNPAGEGDAEWVLQ